MYSEHSNKTNDAISITDSAGNDPVSRRTFLASTAVAAVATPGALQSARRATAPRWIWDSHAGPVNTWMCFRHTLNLTSAPKHAIATIAVDSKYWLWINGRLALFEGGLKRGPRPGETYYDQLDLSRFLTAGKNAIAILVWYWGKSGFSHVSSGQGGLYFNANIDGIKIISNRHWKALAHPAYGPSEPPSPNYRLSEWNVHFDARKDIPDWTHANFNDSAWPSAIEKGIAGDKPWGPLKPRPVAFWKHGGIRPYVNDHEIKALKFGESLHFPVLSILNQSKLPKTLKGSRVWCQLPYDAQVTPYLKVDAPAGLVVDIRTDRYFPGANSVRSQYVTTSGVQEFESLGWMSGEHVVYSFPPGVRILQLGYRESGYNCAFAGHFTSSDPALNKLWNRAQRTLYVNMRDNYSDCPDRERGLWWGDVVIDLGQTFYSLDRRADRLLKKAIDNLVGWQEPATGVLYAPVPSLYTQNELPSQMLASIGWYGFWTYYLHTGDAATIRNAYSHVRRYLSLYPIGADGLAPHRHGGWPWYDWGKNIDGRLLDNTWLYLALKSAVQMAKLTGHYADIPAYQHAMHSIASHFNTAYWNGTAYRSRDYKGQTDDRGNAMAILCGFAKEPQFPSLLKVLQTQMHASPYMEKYVLESLFHMNQPNAAIARMKKRYARFLSLPISTLPERWDCDGYNGSYNHGWSGGPLTLMSQKMAGISPVAPGCIECQILPQPGNVKHISASMLATHGLISVDLNNSHDHFEMSIDLPSPIRALAGVPVRSRSWRSISINGESVNLHRGRGIQASRQWQYQGQSRGFHLFALPPGKYVCTAVT